MRLRLIAFSAAAFLSACGEKPAPAPTEPAPAAATPAAQQSFSGATLSYTRSNKDGTLPERIIMHIVSPTEVHVAKMVERCTDAAYVTAMFNPATQEATRLVGGRLQKDGTQLPQAYLDLDRAADQLVLRLGDPASAPAETLAAPAAPWRMYDFDLAEFALFGPREAKDFTFGLALTWPDGPPPLVRNLGPINATYIATPPEAAASSAAILNNFELSGSGLPGGGKLWTDATDGHVVRAEIARPNHAEYADFLLKLDSVARENGDQAWRDAIAAHWKDCPA